MQLNSHSNNSSKNNKNQIVLSTLFCIKQFFLKHGTSFLRHHVEINQQWFPDFKNNGACSYLIKNWYISSFTVWVCQHYIFFLNKQLQYCTLLSFLYLLQNTLTMSIRYNRTNVTTMSEQSSTWGEETDIYFQIHMVHNVQGKLGCSLVFQVYGCCGR